jgi:hypothetical protein
VSTKLAANECLRQVRYNYPDAELIEKAKALSATLNHYAATENELARVKKDYGARIDVTQAQIDQLKECVQTGYEMREYVCFWEFDVPAPGRKTLRKREGGEIVTEEEMTQRDRQMVMDIIDAQAAAEPTPQVERLALPAPKEWPTAPIEVILTEEQANAESFFSHDQTADWSVRLREIFTDYKMGEPAKIRTKDEAAEYAISLIENQPDAELQRMAEWLTTGPRANIPGTEWLASEIQTALDDVEQQRLMQADAEKARQAAAKKAARAGRKANTSGTVDCAADEGSRDDAGSDSKNNL